MQWFAQAPSNIALIKYMGKKETESNLPMNPSLSYTLNQLISSVTMEVSHENDDRWEPLISADAVEFTLPMAAQERYLRHLSNLKSKFNYTGTFIVRSNNNFPHSTGLASSASSFAALTKCAVIAMAELTQQAMPEIETQAAWSRAGSGSSCRSFFSPWALWTDNEVKTVDLPYPTLSHEVIVISHTQKKVSSSEAHRRVSTSKLYPTRHQRAVENLEELLSALTNQDWHAAYRICWREFQDMHSLFESCHLPFSYITDKTRSALKCIESQWEKDGDGPLVTMDAGPNIHLLYRPDQAKMANEFKQNCLVGNYNVL